MKVHPKITQQMLIIQTAQVVKIVIQKAKIWRQIIKKEYKQHRLKNKDIGAGFERFEVQYKLKECYVVWEFTLVTKRLFAKFVESLL